MRARLHFSGLILLLVLGTALAAAACCPTTGPASPTPAPSATPWVIIITATPPPTLPPTAGPPPTPGPTQPPSPTPIPTRPPLPTPTVPTPEPGRPVVSIIAPADGASYSVGQAVSVEFTAGDQSGLTRAELYVNDSLVKVNDYPQRPRYIGNDGLAWTASAPGNYTIKVVVRDTFNNASVDQRNIVVRRNVTAPTVQLIFPTQRVVIVANQNIQIQALINDEVGIQGLDLVERVNGQEQVFTSDPNYHGAPYTWQVYWRSANLGDHVLFVRARDANGGVGQSPDFTIGVTDNDPPRVQPSYSATALSPGSDLKVHVEAVDSKGVKELRLYVDGNIVDQWFAPDPGVGLSHASVDLWWRGVGPAGGHTAFVWAVDTIGNPGRSPDQGIQVIAAPPTPTVAPPTPTPPPPPPTPTPRPAPPQAAIEQPQNGFHQELPNAVHFVVSAAGGAPLDRVELWGFPQGQLSPQLYHTWPAGGQHQFAGEFDWTPPAAGAFFFFARAHDVTGQHGQSEQIIGYVDHPPTPSALGKWGAQVGDEGFIIHITAEEGGTLQGTFMLRSAQGQTETFPLVNSTIQGNRVTVHAQVAPPGGAPVTYNFMLTLSGDGRSMSGQWSTSVGGVLQPITFNRLVGQ